MSKLRLIVILMLLVICAYALASSLAQDNADKIITNENFTFSYDYAFFRSQQGFVLLELYYSVFRNYLKYNPSEDQWIAEFEFNAEVWQDDSLLASTQWKNIDTIDSLSQISPSQKLYGIGYFALKPGFYKLKVEMKDLHSAFSRSFLKDLQVRAFSESELDVSEIQFASQINRSDVQNRFYKNGYTVIPNTDCFYGTGLPVVMFYLEIYNLKQDNEPDSTKYGVAYKIIDSDGRVAREFPEKVRPKPGNSAVEVSGVNIISFRSGTYFLEIAVRDIFSDKLIARQKKFFIYREGDLAYSDSAAKLRMRERLDAAYDRIYGQMTEEEIDDEFGAAGYIAANDEKKIFKTLDLAGKRTFLVEFWKKRDDTPSTPENEVRSKYLDLASEAKEQFRDFKKGWQTDRGRVLLMYGRPDEIERFPYSAENKPYVIWKYFSIQGGVIFIFVDKREFGRFELVHSTARGELNDSEWERWIRPN